MNVKRRILFLLSLTVLGLFQAAYVEGQLSKSGRPQGKAGDGKFVSEDDGFKVSFPGQPVISKTNVGPSKVRVFRVLLASLDYQVVISEPFTKTADKEELKNIYQDVTGNTVKDLGSKLIKYEDIMVGDNAGYEIITENKGGRYQGLGLLRDGKYFQVFVHSSSPEHAKKKEGLIQAFLDSFELIQ